MLSAAARPEMATTIQNQANGAEPTSGSGFKQLLDGLGFDKIQGLTRQLESGKIADLQSMLQYQVQIHRLGIKVELLSKVAESAAASFRKLQNQG